MGDGRDENDFNLESCNETCLRTVCKKKNINTFSPLPLYFPIHCSIDPWIGGRGDARDKNSLETSQWNVYMHSLLPILFSNEMYFQKSLKLFKKKLQTIFHSTVAFLINFPTRSILFTSPHTLLCHKPPQSRRNLNFYCDFGCLTVRFLQFLFERICLWAVRTSARWKIENHLKTVEIVDASEFGELEYIPVPVRRTATRQFGSQISNAHNSCTENSSINSMKMKSSNRKFARGRRTSGSPIARSSDPRVSSVRPTHSHPPFGQRENGRTYSAP